MRGPLRVNVPGPLRVVQVVNVRWYNATAWYGLTAGQCLRDAGHESLILSIPESDPLRKAEEMGLPYQAYHLNTVHPIRLLRLYRQLDRMLTDFKPHIVDCHRGEAFVLWALLKRRHSFALIRTRGDQRLPKNNAINRYLHCRAADAVVATNSAMARHFREVLHVPGERIHTVLGGVDGERFCPNAEARRAVRARYGFAEQDLVIGLVGRLDEVKGVPCLIRAVALAQAAMPERRLRLLLLAFPSQYGEAELARYCAEAGLSFQGMERAGQGEAASVTFTGKVAAPEQVINAMDLGVVASLGSEAIARAALEIMACGVPLISSRVGVMPDLLAPEYLFPAGDSVALAVMLQKVLNPSWLQGLQQACFDRMREGRGLLPDFLEQTMALYERGLDIAHVHP